MNVSPLNRLIAAAVLCSLLFQSCRPGLHAIIEEPVLKQGPPTPADHMQTSGEAMPSGALAVASSRTDARVSGMLGRVSPAELVSAVGPSSPQFFAEPFTASSGSRVLLSQQRGQWQAVLQGGVGTMMHRRALPVVGAGDIGASLAALRGVDAWSSRSRIHVLAMPTPPYSPCVYVGRLGLLGGMQAQQTQPPVEEQQLLFQIESSGKKDRVAYQIPSGYRYTGYRVKEKVLENVSFLKIYYVEANNEEEVRRLEALKNGRLIAGKVGASVNALFGYTVDLGSFEAGANSLIVKDRESIQVRRSKHAALVVEGGTKGKMLPLSQAKSCIKVLLEVCLAQDTTPPPDIPSSPTNAHNHAQPNFYTQYPHPQWDNFFHETQELRRDYESKLDAAQEQKRQLQRDYENKLDEVEEHKRQLARQTSLLKQKEAQLNTKAQEYKCLSEAHAALEASRAALEQKCAEQLATAAEEHEKQLAHQTSLLKQKEAQLRTKEREHERLSEAHAASQAALERKCAEQLAAAAEEHEKQLAHQTSLLKQKEAQLNTKAQEYKCLSEAHAALEASRAALEQECAERLSTAAEEHERQLARQTSLLKQKEAQLNTKEQEQERLSEAYAALEASQAALGQKLAAAEEHKRQLARQTSLLKQKEAQLNTKAQEYKCLSEAHAASQAALERKCAEQLATAAEEHERQLVHQTSLLKQKEAQLNTKEQERQRLAGVHAALGQELAAAVEAHKTQLAHQVSLCQTAEEALKQKEQEHAASQEQLQRDYERQLDEARVSQAALGQELAAAVEAHKTQLAQVLVSSLAFGEKQWKQYFGEVGAAPRLPVEIGEVLNSPCPFWEGKQVKDTHLLVLMPAKVNDKPFSLNLLKELIQNPKEGVRSPKRYPYNKDVRSVLGKQSFDNAYWVLMTREVLPKSRTESYKAQRALIAGHAIRTSLPYELPGALEAATAILSHYVRSGDVERLSSVSPWTYTRCQELVSIEDHNYPTVVSGFNGSGLSVSYDFSDAPLDDRYGVACCRRFSCQP
jgi:hypothetical protein